MILYGMWRVDECPDVLGHWSIREEDGTEHGDTDTLIATVYMREIADIIVADHNAMERSRGAAAGVGQRTEDP